MNIKIKPTCSFDAKYQVLAFKTRRGGKKQNFEKNHDMVPVVKKLSVRDACFELRLKLAHVCSACKHDIDMKGDLTLYICQLSFQPLFTLYIYLV